MVAGENRFAPELNEKEDIELLDLFNISGAFSIKQLFHSRLLDIYHLSYPTRASGIIVN